MSAFASIYIQIPSLFGRDGLLPVKVFSFFRYSFIFERFFITGVSPIMLDELASGFNILSDMTVDPGFNEMILRGEKPIEEIRIVSSTGQILYFDEPRSTSLKINTSEYSGGLYYVIVKSQNNLQTIKWMKQ